MEVRNLFANSEAHTTAEWKRYLDVVIWGIKHRDKDVKDLVKDWESQLTIWSTITEARL